MSTQDKDTEPKIVIDGYKVTAVDCQSGASARNLAAERIRQIEKRVAEIKAERTALNRQKHILAKFLTKVPGPGRQPV
jgi:hypothetical protein